MDISAESREYVQFLTAWTDPEGIVAPIKASDIGYILPGIKRAGRMVIVYGDHSDAVVCTEDMFLRLPKALAA